MPENRFPEVPEESYSEFAEPKNSPCPAAFRQEASGLGFCSCPQQRRSGWGSLDVWPVGASFVSKKVPTGGCPSFVTKANGTNEDIAWTASHPLHLCICILILISCGFYRARLTLISTPGPLLRSSFEVSAPLVAPWENVENVFFCTSN